VQSNVIAVYSKSL